MLFVGIIPIFKTRVHNGRLRSEDPKQRHQNYSILKEQKQKNEEQTKQEELAWKSVYSHYTYYSGTRAFGGGGGGGKGGIIMVLLPVRLTNSHFYLVLVTRTVPLFNLLQLEAMRESFLVIVTFVLYLYLAYLKPMCETLSCACNAYCTFIYPILKLCARAFCHVFVTRIVPLFSLTRSYTRDFLVWCL